MIAPEAAPATQAAVGARVAKVKTKKLPSPDAVSALLPAPPAQKADEGKKAKISVLIDPPVAGPAVDKAYIDVAVAEIKASAPPPTAPATTPAPPPAGSAVPIAAPPQAPTPVAVTPQVPAPSVAAPSLLAEFRELGAAIARGARRRYDEDDEDDEDDEEDERSKRTKRAGSRAHPFANRALPTEARKAAVDEGIAGLTLTSKRLISALFKHAKQLALLEAPPSAAPETSSPVSRAFLLSIPVKVQRTFFESAATYPFHFVHHFAECNAAALADELDTVTGDPLPRTRGDRTPAPALITNLTQDQWIRAYSRMAHFVSLVDSEFGMALALHFQVVMHLIHEYPSKTVYAEYDEHRRRALHCNASLLATLGTYDHQVVQTILANPSRPAPAAPGRADRDRGRESGRRNAQAGRTPPAKPSHPVASALSKEPCNGFQRGFCKQPSCTRGHFCSRCDATDHGRATCPTVAAAIAASAGASARP
jgi:hypothetical protein